MLRLEFPNETHQEMYENMIEEWSKEDDFHETSPGLLFEGKSYRDFLEYIQKVQQGLIDGYTPSSLYFGVVGSKIIGGIDIRHNIKNPLLQDYYGHVGYGIRPSERKKGYATKMLELGLELLRNIGIDKALVCCQHGNIGSEKTILRNGGIFDKQVIKDGEKLNRYWITL